MKNSIAKLKPWYYFFAFLIALPYAAVNEGDSVFHIRYLVAYALLIMAVVSYKVRYKKEAQKSTIKESLNTTDKAKDTFTKVVSIVLQFVFAWMLCFMYVGLLSVIGGGATSKAILIPVFFSLIVIGIQATIVVSVYSRAFADIRKLVYWLGTSFLLGITILFSNINLYGKSDNTNKSIYTAIGVAILLQIVGYFAMKVKVADSSVPTVKKV